MTNTGNLTSIDNMNCISSVAETTAPNSTNGYGGMMMSLFNAPIAPQRDGQGRFLCGASLVPAMEVDVSQVYNLITRDERLRELTARVRSAADMRAAKAALLPYVTPCGVFSRRKAGALVRPSGLVVVDIDHLPSPEAAERIKQALIIDRYLRPALVFTSPSGLGVKAFVPYANTMEANAAANITANTAWAMAYVSMAYGGPAGGASVDVSGKDVARACFLCHDEKAKLF